jgi:glucosyl-dolichyl phosphate glucuronosyltransferase
VSATAWPGLPTVSVVIAAFTMERWAYLQEAVASVSAQTEPVLETVVVIDHHPGLLAQARHSLTGVTVIPNAGGRGASGARNTGVAASRGEVVAFLDDDVVALPTWLASLLPHFSNSDVVGVGGRLEPLWAGSEPRWFPPEFGWAVGTSYRGMPEVAEPVRNVWSGNMAIRRRVFDSIGGFRAGFGKVGGCSRPEDTDLCLRAAAAHEHGTWIYEPAGVAWHRVPASRATPRYFLRRCFHEGRGKAELAALNGVAESTSAERRYTCRLLPAGVVRGLRDVTRGDVSGGLRSVAITAGFAVALAGFVMGRVAGIIHRHSTRPGGAAAGTRPRAAAGTRLRAASGNGHVLRRGGDAHRANSR